MIETAHAASRSLVTQEAQLVTLHFTVPDYFTKPDLSPFGVAKAISVLILGGVSSAHTASRSLVTQDERLATHAPPRPHYSTKPDLAPENRADPQGSWSAQLTRRRAAW